MKFAIIGAGAIGLEHIRNIQILEGCQVTAVADPVETSQRLAKKILGDNNDQVRYVEDYKVLLEMDEIDTLIICTPNFHHIHVLRDAIISSKKTFYAKNHFVHDDSGLLGSEGFGTKALYRGKPAVFFGLEWSIGTLGQ